MKTVYLILAFTYQKQSGKRELIAEQFIKCANAREAIKRAERMSAKKVGVIAVSQEVTDGEYLEWGKLI